MVGLTTYFRCLPRGTDCPGSASRDEAFCRGLRDAKGKQPQCGSRRDIAGLCCKVRLVGDVSA